MYEYIPSGVCSRKINFDIVEENGKKVVRSVAFTGGCHGNTQGVAILAEGMPAEELVSKLGNVRCGDRPSSCPGQLAAAVKKALEA